jgi:hypothetical protein
MLSLTSRANPADGRDFFRDGFIKPRALSLPSQPRL